MTEEIERAITWQLQYWSEPKAQVAVEQSTTERTEVVAFEAESAPHPNFGPDDVYAIKSIAYIMNGIFVIALVLYSTITLTAFFTA